MARLDRIFGLVLATSVVGCGGSCPRAAGEETASAETAASEAPPKPVAREEPEPAEEKTEGASEGTETRSSSSSASSESQTPSSGAEKSAGVEPQFPEHATVSQAMAAIPAGTERANIDPDTLSLPLQDHALYEPCNPGTQHFKIKVAVWDGRAVGVDVTTPNKKLAECVDGRVRSVVWKKKVKSLNTVEYAL